MRYFLYRLKYRYGKHFGLTAPVDVSLELSSHCNMSCGYCYHNSEHPPFEKGFMSWELAKSVINQSAELGVNSLKFNYRGESTLNPRFYDIVSYAHTLALGSTFIDRLTNSNFKFATDRDDIFLGLCKQTKVKVSYDSFNKEIFEAQRIKGIHELTTANITRFYQMRERKNTELVIQVVRTQQNKDEDFESELKKRWPSASLSIRDVVGGRIDRDISKFEHRSRDFEHRQSCLQAHVRLIVHHDGRVGPCCPSIKNDLIVGDAKTDTISEIFNGKKAVNLRKELESKFAFNYNPCRTCSSFESYKGFKPSWDS